jgi:peptide/nickel transport system substrate-binding protein
VSAVGNYEVVYHLSQQNSQLPYGLADRAGMIPSPTAVAKEGKQFGTHPVGAGPYSFVSENPGATYSFARYDGYWNNANQPRVQNIRFQIFGNDTSLVAAVRSGTVNMAGAVFPQDVQTLKANPNLDVAVGPGTAFDMVYFNGRMKPFDNPQVRLAFNLALNRKAIMDAATDGLGQVWTEPVAPNTFGYSASAVPVWTYDPTRAKRLMAQAGYPNGVDATCYTYPGLGYDITAPIVISEEKAVGINIKVISGTPAQVVPFYTENLAPCYLSGWLGGPNPVTTYEGILWSKSYYNAGKTDFGVDKYINQFFTTYTTSGYNSLFDSINQAMKTNPGYAVIYANPSINVYQKNVGGWVISPFELDNWQGLYFTS